MTLEEFNFIRKPFYIEPDSMLVRFPTQKHMNCSHADWFNDVGYVWLHTIRGYYLHTEEDEFIMIYWNDFEIPNVNASFFVFLFEYFPNIKWIGLGCNKGEIGEIWEPKLKITRG